MKRILGILCLLLFMTAGAAASAKTPALPKTLTNARYVYVTSYDGDEFNPNLFPEDRNAIAAVQDAMQKSGKFVIVYRPREADIVLMVQSRPSEDVLAVYDAHGWPRSNYLWRVMGRSGLRENETPLVSQFEKAFEQASK